MSERELQAACLASGKVDGNRHVLCRWEQPHPIGLDGAIHSVENADFYAQEAKLKMLKTLHDERGGTLLSFFQCGSWVALCR